MHSNPQSFCNWIRKTEDNLWLKLNNPEIDWEKCTPTWRKEQDNSAPIPKPMVGEEIDQENWKNHTINPIKELDDEEIGNAV